MLDLDKMRRVPSQSGGSLIDCCGNAAPFTRRPADLRLFMVSPTTFAVQSCPDDLCSPDHIPPCLPRGSSHGSNDRSYSSRLYGVSSNSWMSSSGRSRKTRNRLTISPSRSLIVSTAPGRLPKTLLPIQQKAPDIPSAHTLREMRYDPIGYTPFRPRVSDYCFHFFLHVMDTAPLPLEASMISTKNYNRTAYLYHRLVSLCVHLPKTSAVGFVCRYNALIVHSPKLWLKIFQIRPFNNAVPNYGFCCDRLLPNIRPQTIDAIPMLTASLKATYTICVLVDLIRDGRAMPISSVLYMVRSQSARG